MTLSNKELWFLVFGFLILFFLLITRLNLQWTLKTAMSSPCPVSSLTFYCRRVHVQALAQPLQGVVCLQRQSPWALGPMAVACQGAEQVTQAARTLLALQKSLRYCRHHEQQVKSFVFTPHYMLDFFPTALHKRFSIVRVKQALRYYAGIEE